MNNTRYSMFENYHDTALKFSKGDMNVYGRLMFIINMYALKGETPDNLSPSEEMFLDMAKISIDKSIALSNAGTKGGKACKPDGKACKPDGKACNEVEEEVEEEGEKEVEDEMKGEEEERPETATFTPSQTEYAKKIFDKFKSAGLSCWKNNFLSFYQHDFVNTLKKRQGIHSDEVLQAVDNYIKELNDPNSYVTQGYGFETFVFSKLFIQMLPANYQHNNFIRFDVKLKKSQNNLKADMYSGLDEKADTVRSVIAKDTRFNSQVFELNIADWISAGMPTEPEPFFNWQAKYEEVPA